VADRVPEPELEAVARLAAQPGWPRASGAGRLFEAAGALLGLCEVNGWEGEAAARLEALAAEGPVAPPWPEVALASAAGPPRLPSARLLERAAARLLSGESSQAVASGFHATFCELAAELVARVAPSGQRLVVLGGGCLVNRLLRRGLNEALAQRGFEPLLPAMVPPGDGGLAYGQASLAAAALRAGRDGWLLEPR
jgi:hydrogenase maturation protein HypF